MKALITAGGHGTRLRPITYTLNKHLIPMANKPMIFYVLEKIEEAGITEVGININPGDEDFKRVVGDGSRWNMRITYIEQVGGALGLGHVVKNAESFLGVDDFVFYLGDNIFLGSIIPFIEEFKKNNANCQLALSKVKDPQRFGVAEIKDGRIVSIVEKPKEPKSPYAVTGIYIYDHNVFKATGTLQPSWRNELEISDVHQWYIDNGYKVGYKEITGWWKDTGKPIDLIEGNSLLLSQLEHDIQCDVHEDTKIQGKVQIGKGTQIDKNTIIRGPVKIGENCKITNSYIGPYTALGDGVQVTDTEIEHSMVFDEARLSCNKRIVDSIVGKNAELKSFQKTLPLGHKLIVGDNSSIEL